MFNGLSILPSYFDATRKLWHAREEEQNDESPDSENLSGRAWRMR
jgi:hypothetical protein